MTVNQLPLEFEQAMQKRLASSFPDFMQSLKEAIPVSIRLNPIKKYSAARLEKIPWSKHGRYLDERPVFTLDPLLHAGAYYVQEASSMLLEQAFEQSVDLSAGIKVLDLCAAPGGKSTHLLSLMNDKSLLVSNEVIRSRASVLSENIQKWGYGNAVVTNNDPQDFQRLTGFFDVIVVDAPCSGEGLFRKDPEAMTEWSMENVMLCSQRQQRIVADIWPALKEDGVLIYSTCTYNEKENEDNLKWLNDNKNCEFVPLTLNANWGIEEIKKEKTIGYRCYPHKVRGEGFFISVIRKRETEQAVSVRAKNSFQFANRTTKESLAPWLQPHEQELVILNDLIVSLPANFAADINFLSRSLNTLMRGTAIATQKHDKYIPEHSLALSTQINQANFKTIELTLDQALSYLRKDNLLIGEGERGFTLVTYQGVPLGWVNLLGNRLNNLYPSGWRIMMK